MVMLNLLPNKRISWKVIKSNVTKEGEVENRCWQQLLLVLAAARQKAAKTCSKALRPAPAWTLTRCLSTLIPTFALDLFVLRSGTHCWMLWYSLSWLCLRNDFFQRGAHGRGYYSPWLPPLGGILSSLSLNFELNTTQLKHHKVKISPFWTMQ